ncbi:hypothetical protein LSH36_919g00003 [Paralvinella palmiformis]|uniref:Uncharacterized protein n=1 Tax=Paralvinella palmiformis TaxID=53620 RepID=A0AAD9IYK5_9ANNE|nr:hypothetical protein LSH36_919g00003 [Paralvinella palmiformis]
MADGPCPHGLGYKRASGHGFRHYIASPPLLPAGAGPETTGDHLPRDYAASVNPVCQVHQISRTHSVSSTLSRALCISREIRKMSPPELIHHPALITRILTIKWPPRWTNVVDEPPPPPTSQDKYVEYRLRYCRRPNTTSLPNHLPIDKRQVSPRR